MAACLCVTPRNDLHAIEPDYRLSDGRGGRTGIGTTQGLLSQKRMAPISEEASRFRPRPWDRLYYPLSELREAVLGVLTQQIKLAPGVKVLDIGCGTCPYRQVFDDAGCTYVACDMDGDVDVQFLPGSMIDLPDQTADGVVSFQVLEHVWDLNWYLGECLRLLKPGGWLLLSTHGCWPYHPHPTDYRRWTHDGLRKELEVRGFSVVQLSGIVGPLAWATYLRLYAAENILKRVPVVGPPALAILALLMNIRMCLEDAITPFASRQRNACTYVVLARRP